MYNVLFLIFFSPILLIGCGGGEGGDEDGNDVLPSLVFSGEYSLADFNLKNAYIYWEIRRGSLPQDDNSEYDVINKYDQTAYDNLDDTEIQIISETVSQIGFSNSCLPSFCPIYAVALMDYTASVIDSESSLRDFFGDIDTEAELSVLLDYAESYATSTEPEAYEILDDGYLVVLKWDTLCQLRGKDLVKVHKDGTIEKIRELSTESYVACF